MAFIASDHYRPLPSYTPSRKRWPRRALLGIIGGLVLTAAVGAHPASAALGSLALLALVLAVLAGLNPSGGFAVCATVTVGAMRAPCLAALALIASLTGVGMLGILALWTPLGLPLCYAGAAAGLGVGSAALGFLVDSSSP